MNARDTLHQALLATGDTCAVHHYRLHAVSCDQPLLIIPLSGTKKTHAAGRHWTCLPGQFLMVHGAMQADMENQPNAPDTPYRAWVAAFPWEVIALARKLLGEAALPAVQDVPISTGELPAIIDALQAYIADIGVADPALRDYRLLGILLSLHRAGHAQFLHAHDPSLSARIRLAVTQMPARDWPSAHFEDMFNMSGATLRRRLSGEGATLRALVQEARLHAALMRLQNSRAPVKAVARDVGYRSVASFRRNFIERFGIDPSQVANA